MQDSQVKFVMILLLALQTIPFFITHYLVSGFQYEDEEERTWVVRRSVPINILCNVIVWILSFSVIFSGHSSFFQLIKLQGSYQDAGRLVLCSVVCVMVSAVIAYGGMRVYLGGDWEDLRLSRSSAGRVLLLVSLMIVPWLLGASVSRTGLHHLIISGYCRKTVSYLYNYKTEEAEEDNGSYVLIRNNGTFTVEAEGLYLSEDDRFLHNLRLKSIKLGPGESFRQDFTSDVSLNVKKDGGSIIFLSDAEETILDSIVVPALKEEETYLLSDNEWTVVGKVLPEETPAVTVAPPVFSLPAGFYDNEFELTLTSEPGTTIYYTLDCSEPTTDSTRYDTPIHVYDRSNDANEFRSVRNVIRDYLRTEPANTPVKKAFIIRAISVDEYGNSSAIQTNSYFIGLKSYEQGTVVSLVIAPENLFDPQTGIYVVGKAYDDWYKKQFNPKVPLSTVGEPAINFLQRGVEWERPAQFIMFENGEQTINQLAGVRIQGASARSRAIKRFSIYARKQYSGSSFFDIPLYGDNYAHSVTLREGFDNSFIPYLVTDRAITAASSREVRVFLNGEFWYNTFMQEKFSEKLFSERYGLSKDNVQVLKIGYLSSASDEEKKLFDSFIQQFFLIGDLSIPENFDRLNELVDIQSYIDFTCINVYMANMDTTDSLNTLLWRTIIKENDSYGDGRWRWSLYDLDMLRMESVAANNNPSPAQINSFSDTMPFNKRKMNEEPFFSALKQNPSFCKQFVLTFMDLANHNFRKERIQEMMAYLGRDIATYQDGFYLYRDQYIIPYMAEEFGLTSTPQKVTVSSNLPEKSVRLNTLNLELEETEPEVPETMPWEAWKAQFMEPQPPYYGWEGLYFTEYPVTVSTEEPDFLRWEVTSGEETKTFTDRTIEVPVVEGGVEIHAIFK